MTRRNVSYADGFATTTSIGRHAVDPGKVELVKLEPWQSRTLAVDYRRVNREALWSPTSCET
jgi:hypothetical protein